MQLFNRTVQNVVVYWAIKPQHLVALVYFKSSLMTVCLSICSPGHKLHVHVLNVHNIFEVLLNCGFQKKGVHCTVTYEHTSVVLYEQYAIVKKPHLFDSFSTNSIYFSNFPVSPEQFYFTVRITKQKITK